MSKKEILVTGGAGFIGRWIVKQLLEEGYRVTALDNLTTGSLKNIAEFRDDPGFSFIEGSVLDGAFLDECFRNTHPEVCFHLAANSVVQDSIDNPEKVFKNDVAGTFNLLETCRAHGTRMLFMSTCMVYERSSDWAGITETHATNPVSPFGAFKIAGEAMALSYWHAYGLPITIVRPFNTYGPFQRADGEGGVVAAFTERKVAGKPLRIYGNGKQTRDLIDVTDCAAFAIQAAMSGKTTGEILNVGTGRDVTINQLAEMITAGKVPIEHIPHSHPQNEFPKLLCNYKKARDLLAWRPQVKLEAGLKRFQSWMEGKSHE
jgi:nucleoside-diphosphate-sugar epimerase